MTHAPSVNRQAEHAMSIDPSLKTEGNLTTVRNVMTRAERIAALKEDGKFKDGKNTALGLPKTKVKE
jgi:small basic protein (TIGR04137 family)